MSDIEPNPENIRKTVSKKFRESLVANVREMQKLGVSKGIFAPIKVMEQKKRGGKKYMIRAGHTRFGVLKEIGVKELEIGRDVIVDNNPETFVIENYVENKMHPRLHVIEEADGLLRLLKKRFGAKSAEYFIRELARQNEDVVDYIALYGESVHRAMSLLRISTIPQELKDFMLQYRGVKIGFAEAVARHGQSPEIVKKAVRYLSEGTLLSGSAITMIKRDIDIVQVRKKEFYGKGASARTRNMILTNPMVDPSPEPESAAKKEVNTSLGAVGMDCRFAMDTVRRWMANPTKPAAGEVAKAERILGETKKKLEGFLHELSKMRGG